MTRCCSACSSCALAHGKPRTTALGAAVRAGQRELGSRCAAVPRAGGPQCAAGPRRVPRAGTSGSLPCLGCRCERQLDAAIRALPDEPREAETAECCCPAWLVRWHKGVGPAALCATARTEVASLARTCRVHGLCRALLVSGPFGPEATRTPCCSAGRRGRRAERQHGLCRVVPRETGAAGAAARRVGPCVWHKGRWDGCAWRNWSAWERRALLSAVSRAPLGPNTAAEGDRARRGRRGGSAGHCGRAPRHALAWPVTAPGGPLRPKRRQTLRSGAWS